MMRDGYNEDGQIGLKSRYTNEVELAGLSEWRGTEFVAIFNVQKTDFFFLLILKKTTYFNSVEKEPVVKPDECKGKLVRRSGGEGLKDKEVKVWGLHRQCTTFRHRV